MGGAGVTVTTASIRGHRHLGRRAKQTDGDVTGVVAAHGSPRTTCPVGHDSGRRLPSPAQGTQGCRGGELKEEGCFPGATAKD